MDKNGLLDKNEAKAVFQEVISKSGSTHMKFEIS